MTNTRFGISFTDARVQKLMRGKEQVIMEIKNSSRFLTLYEKDKTLCSYVTSKPAGKVSRPRFINEMSFTRFICDGIRHGYYTVSDSKCIDLPY